LVPNQIEWGAIEEDGDSLSIKAENLEGLGMVAGVIDPIGLREIIDDNLGRHSLQKVTTG
jgi:hypothetical protein